MKDHYFGVAALALLDDCETAENGLALQQLTRARTTVPKIIVPKQPATSTTPPRAENRFFSSTPSLRQMMNEYNRPGSSLAPLKSEPKSPTQPQHGHDADFKFDRCDFIDLPNIPGRVLRPARQSDV